MNTRRVNAAAGVIFAAQKTRKTAAGIALCLESAQLLQSPESAAEQLAVLAEVDRLRLRVAELEAETAKLIRWHREDGTALAKAEARVVELRAENTRLHALVAQLGARAEQRHLVDPLDHVLEHLADERPEVTS